MLTDTEKAHANRIFCSMVNELSLSEKDEKIVRDLLKLIAAWKLKSYLLKRKAEKEQKERILKIEKGMSFSNAEKQLREYAR